MKLDSRPRRRLPQGASAAAQRRSIRSDQGAVLPPDGSPISAYPTKCCVLIDAAGERAWHMILMRIGGHGEPHVGRLSSPPSSLDWNSGMGDAVSVPERTVVHASAWPNRESVQESDSVDPLVLSSQVDGSLMLGHVRSAQDPEPGPGSSR